MFYLSFLCFGIIYGPFALILNSVFLVECSDLSHNQLNGQITDMFSSLSNLDFM